MGASAGGAAAAGRSSCVAFALLPNTPSSNRLPYMTGWSACPLALAIERFKGLFSLGAATTTLHSVAVSTYLASCQIAEIRRL